jgi:hypothetical protein
VSSSKSPSTFRSNVAPPSSGPKNKTSKGPTKIKRQALCVCLFVFFFAWLIIRFKTQAVNFSETSVDYYQTKQRHIPHYSVLISHFNNLKFNVFLISFYVKVIYTVSFITKSLSLQLTK